MIILTDTINESTVDLSAYPDITASTKENIVKGMQLLMGNGTYDKRVRPVPRAEETLEVAMEVQLKSMFDVSVW